MMIPKQSGGGYQNPIIKARVWQPACLFDADHSCIVLDSAFLELYSRFQSPGFRIPEAKFSRIPNSRGILLHNQKLMVEDSTPDLLDLTDLCLDIFFT